MDTHAFIWLIEDNENLTQKIKKIYLDNSNEVYLSIASIWEMVIKISLNKLSLEGKLSTLVEKHAVGNNVKLLSIQPSHVISVTNLPFHHKDPFDRLLISQCLQEKLNFLSKDKTFDLYGVKRIW